MNRVVAAAFALLLVACGKPDPFDDPGYAAACHGPPLRTIEERNQAQMDGYSISVRYDCIEKESWEAVQNAHALVSSMVANAEKEVAAQKARTSRSLAEARRGFQTQLGAEPSGRPLPEPPAALFVRHDYDSPSVGILAAWVTPDPRDGEKHPAIVWITGGESNSLDEFWTDGGPDNDQSASAFREAGMIMMFPTLRGGNTNAGRREYFLGEVEDIIAAAAHLARLPYVDRVYLGGHSTGGTLALLTAESSAAFAGVFAFGPVSDPDDYGRDLLPFDIDAGDPREHELRAPIYWLHGISTPTYLIEGSDAPANSADLETLCAKAKNEFVHCVPVPGKNHVSVLDAVSKKLAARIVTGVAGDKPLVRAEEFGATGAGPATAAP